jgi:spermidine synthase
VRRDRFLILVPKCAPHALRFSDEIVAQNGVRRDRFLILVPKCAPHALRFSETKPAAWRFSPPCGMMRHWHRAEIEVPDTLKRMPKKTAPASADPVSQHPQQHPSRHPLQSAPQPPPDGPRFLPGLLLLFAGSGCAALIYEVVWFQLLQLVIGSSAISLGVLLGTYMGGMCLGSLLLPRLIRAKLHPLRVYSAIELGIGICGVLALFGLPLINDLYAAIAGHGAFGIALRAVIAAMCLLPPTLLMGASLPAIARWVETTPSGVSWLGFFYGGNIGGAVLGCLLAGFYLLRLYDMPTATLVAVAINFVVSLISFYLSGKTPYTAIEHEEKPARLSAGSRQGARVIYVAIAISGMCALGAEVIWTRLLSLMLGATVYTFSIILAVFLVGLGIGSAVASQLGRASKRPAAALAACQLLLVAAIAWAAYMLAVSLPYWPINPTLSTSAWYTFQLDLLRCFWVVFPAACLWGASFPLALAAAAWRGEDGGKLVGEVYAANTVGAILGAVGFSLVLIPWLGTQNSQRVLIALAGLAAAIVFVSLRNRRLGAAAIGVLGAMAVVWLVSTVGPVPWLAVAYGRRMLIQSDPGHVLYLGEGRNASVAISELPGGQHYFHVSGKVEASTETYDMRLQRMLAHLPALLHPNPRSVLVVGFGAGVTAGTFVVYPSVRRITICELEPLIPPAATRYFRAENYNVMNDERTSIHYDDARHFILTSKDKYDIITSDPIHPWVKGTATLYSKEYFELCKRHLNPGGIVTQWVPLYESDVQTVKSELATFFEAFPNGTIWGNDINGEGYDTVLLGQAEPTKINVDALQQRLDQPAYASVAKSMQGVGFRSAVDLLSTYAGRAQDLAPWLRDAQINEDLNMRLQYLAGMGLNYDRPVVLYKDILSFRRFPEDIFSGSADHMAALRFAIASAGAAQ